MHAYRSGVGQRWVGERVFVAAQCSISFDFAVLFRLDPFLAKSVSTKAFACDYCVLAPCGLYG